MPRNKPFLLEQVARARRFAQAMNTDADRERFEKLAADYERELDAPERLTAKRPAYRPRRGEGPRQPLTMPLRPRRGPAVPIRLRRHPVRQTSRNRRRISPTRGSRDRNSHRVRTVAGIYGPLTGSMTRSRQSEIWNVAVLKDGSYSAWFKTPRGEGTGIVHFENGKISGGDSIMTYGGFYEVSGDRFTATVTITRHTAGHATVFGIDDLVLKLGGVSKGAIATCTGTADVEPGLTFEATLIRCRSDPSNARTDLPPPKFDPARLPKLTERSRVR